MITASLRQRHRIKCGGLVLLFAGLSLIMGCGKGKRGPDRFPLSGTVTYEGQPIPHGEIQFSPDVKKGNDGPGAVADIRKGKYQTDSGKGTIGGPMIIRIIGFDGKPVLEDGEEIKRGLPLFDPISLEAEIPKEEAVWDYDVTAPPQNGKTKPAS